MDDLFWGSNDQAAIAIVAVENQAPPRVEPVGAPPLWEKMMSVQNLVHP
jgi:hypothetical protein